MTERPKPLSPSVARRRLRALAARPAAQGWTYARGRLRLDARFDSFADAIAFVRAVARVAEAEDHHPDIDVRYSRVRLSLWTHDAGGVTERDFRFIERLSRVRRTRRD